MFMTKRRIVAIPTAHFLRMVDPKTTTRHIQDHIEASRVAETQRTEELVASGVLKKRGPAAMKVHKR